MTIASLYYADRKSVVGAISTRTRSTGPNSPIRTDQSWAQLEAPVELRRPPLDLLDRPGPLRRTRAQRLPSLPLKDRLHCLLRLLRHHKLHRVHNARKHKEHNAQRGLVLRIQRYCISSGLLRVRLRRTQIRLPDALIFHGGGWRRGCASGGGRTWHRPGPLRARISGQYYHPLSLGLRVVAQGCGEGFGEW